MLCDLFELNEVIGGWLLIMAACHFSQYNNTLLCVLGIGFVIIGLIISAIHDYLLKCLKDLDPHYFRHCKLIWGGKENDRYSTTSGR